MVSKMIDKTGWYWIFFRKCDILMLQKIGDSVSSWMDAAQAADKTEIRNRGQRHLPLVRKRGRIMGYEPMNESWQMAGEPMRHWGSMWRRHIYGCLQGFL